MTDPKAIALLFAQGSFFPAASDVGGFSGPFWGAFRCLRVGLGLIELPSTPPQAALHRLLALSPRQKMVLGIDPGLLIPPRASTLILVPWIGVGDRDKKCS